MAKYGNLNFEKIKDKLSNCKPALQLSYIVGFCIKTYDDYKRLIFIKTSENMRKIRIVMQILNMNEEEMNTFICLIEEGYTNQQAINAINLSKEE